MRGKTKKKVGNRKKVFAVTLIFCAMITNTVANAVPNKLGNGNYVCQIESWQGKGENEHHDKGQSNEHKIIDANKEEWLAYCDVNNIKQISNNEGSNGWITFHKLY